MKSKKTAWTFIAIEKQSGLVVGMTETWLNANRPSIAHQDDTGVIASHRGNRLGLTLKYLMLEKLLHNPMSKEVEYWVTENAYSNEHMIKINDELQYKDLMTINYYECKKEILHKYLFHGKG